MAQNRLSNCQGYNKLRFFLQSIYVPASILASPSLLFVIASNYFSTVLYLVSSDVKVSNLADQDIAQNFVTVCVLDPFNMAFTALLSW